MSKTTFKTFLEKNKKRKYGAVTSTKPVHQTNGEGSGAGMSGPDGMTSARYFEKVNPAYLKGLNSKEKKVMKREIKHFKDMPSDDKKAYPKDWEVDKEYRDRKGKLPKSEYTDKYHQMYGEEIEQLTESGVDTALKNKSEKTGIKMSILRAVFNRGMAAWRTGHRPGVAQVQWAMGRVNSFITGGGARKADKDLWEKRK